MAGIWVFSEGRDHLLELIHAGRGLAQDLGTKLVAFALDRTSADTCTEHGCDEVFLLPPLAQDQPLESYVPVLEAAARQEDPDVIFIGATPRGKEIGARLAARLNTGLCSGCLGFELDREKKLLKMDRLVFGGAGIQTVVCSTRPQMAAIPPRTFDRATPQPGKGGIIRELPFTPASEVQVVRRAPKQRGDAVDIAEAKIVVCIGRGLEKKEDLALARQLADVLGGEVGCTRPVAEDLQWLPEEVYLGISGKKIRPNLYIGLGVSGQVQHITGIRDSKVIVAVNRDESAPIFEAADYGIVGDLYKVVPKLIEELKVALKM